MRRIKWWQLLKAIAVWTFVASGNLVTLYQPYGTNTFLKILHICALVVFPLALLIGTGTVLNAVGYLTKERVDAWMKSIEEWGKRAMAKEPTPESIRFRNLVDGVRFGLGLTALVATILCTGLAAYHVFDWWTAGAASPKDILTSLALMSGGMCVLSLSEVLFKGGRAAGNWWLRCRLGFICAFVCVVARTFV